MKKNIVWILMVITVLSLVGCGVGKNEIPYDGEIMESYPSELGNVTNMKIISSIEEEKKNTEEEEQRTGEELPTYEYHGDDMQEAAIIDYFLKENAGDRSYGEVSIPAFCIFQSEVDTDDRIKVYGNFWMFTYSRQGTTLFCESGGETPGVIYLKKDGDHYLVDEFDRVGDGSDYAEDIERICDGNKALKEQYFSATDTRKEPLQTRRLWYISNYVKDNGLDIIAYQDYGWEPIMLSETENWDMKKELTW